MFLDVIYRFVSRNDIFPKEIDHILVALAKWMAITLDVSRAPKIPDKREARTLKRIQPDAQAHLFKSPRWR
jgi:hypothetical protein